MCGIAGILNFDPLQPVDRDELLRMPRALVQRRYSWATQEENLLNLYRSL